MHWVMYNFSLICLSVDHVEKLSRLQMEMASDYWIPMSAAFINNEHFCSVYFQHAFLLCIFSFRSGEPTDISYYAANQWNREEVVMKFSMKALY